MTDYWTCPHIATDHVIPMNGGRFNLTHWLRVLQARTVQAMATVTVTESA